MQGWRGGGEGGLLELKKSLKRGRGGALIFISYLYLGKLR